MHIAEKAQGEDVNIAHTEYFALNDFEDILLWGLVLELENNKDMESDFKEVSESIRNTKII